MFRALGRLVVRHPWLTIAAWVVLGCRLDHRGAQTHHQPRPGKLFARQV